MVDHRLLCRMQLRTSAVEAFHGDQFLAVQRRQELDAGIHGSERESLAAVIEFGQHDGTRAAIAFGTTFLGAGAAEVLAQKLQYGAGRVDVVQLDDLLVGVFRVDGDREGGEPRSDHRCAVQCRWAVPAQHVRFLHHSNRGCPNLFEFNLQHGSKNSDG